MGDSAGDLAPKELPSSFMANPTPPPPPPLPLTYVTIRDNPQTALYDVSVEICPLVCGERNQRYTTFHLGGFIDEEAAGEEADSFIFVVTRSMNPRAFMNGRIPPGLQVARFIKRRIRTYNENFVHRLNGTVVHVDNSWMVQRKHHVLGELKPTFGTREQAMTYFEATKRKCNKNPDCDVTIYRLTVSSSVFQMYLLMGGTLPLLL